MFSGASRRDSHIERARLTIAKLLVRRWTNQRNPKLRATYILIFAAATDYTFPDLPHSRYAEQAQSRNATKGVNELTNGRPKTGVGTPVPV